MTVETEMLVERRQIQQRLTLWRMLAVAFGVFLLLALLAKGGSSGSIHADHIARVNISGMITDDDKQQKILKDLTKDDNVKAVVLRINSGGGTTTGGEALYLHIRKLAKEKPVVAVFGTVAASAAYMAGIGADHIVTRGSTITGSVGVIAFWPDVTEMLAKMGITVKELKSGKLKASIAPYRHVKPEELAPEREMIEDTFKWFIGLVVERRKIKIADVPGLVDGRVYTGRQAVKLGLADEIGGEDEAISWLETKKKVEEDLPVLEHKKATELSFNPLTSMISSLLGRLGLEQYASFLVLQNDFGSVHTKGLMSVWR